MTCDPGSDPPPNHIGCHTLFKKNAEEKVSYVAMHEVTLSLRMTAIRDRSSSPAILCSYTSRRYPALPAPKLAVACAAVKRVHAQKEYSPHNYEVGGKGRVLASMTSIKC